VKIIIIILFFVVLSFVATKIVYDRVFAEKCVDYDCADIGYEYIDIDLDTDKGVIYCRLYPGHRPAMVVIAPGFNADTRDYLLQTQSLLEHGFAVFIFDPLGSGNSSSDSGIGFPREIIDLDTVLKYIETKSNFGYNNILLMGHSRGGYAVCSVMNRYDITAAVTISGMNSSMDGIMSSSSDKIGNIAYINYPMLWLYQTMLFGNETANISASDEIEKASFPILIVQGNDDELYDTDNYSIYSHKDEIQSSFVEYCLCDTPGQNGHTNLLFDGDGEVNIELMETIINFYDRSLGG